MEIVTDSDTATGSRNPSPSLPEGANTLSTDGDAPMELDMYKGKPTASADIKTTPELPPSSCSTTERSNSPASVGESDERSCGGDAVSVEDGGSECSGEKHGAVLTDAMLKEEQRLHDTESRESSSEREKVQLLLGEVFFFSLSTTMLTFLSLTLPPLFYLISPPPPHLS